MPPQARLATNPLPLNVLFIDIDTLRADHLGCYGYPKATSPAIDALASQGVLYEQCYAPGIPTTPAHTTIYTGLHPLIHNIVSHGGTVDLDRKTPLLPEMLQKGGYTTCAVDNLFDVKPWLARGYEFYINPSFHHPNRLMVTCDEINARAIPWLHTHAREPFVLFIHYWDPHTPYLPPQRYRQFWHGGDPADPAIHTLDAMRDGPFWGMWGDTWFRKLGPVTDPEYIVSLYDGEIRYVDHAIGQLLDALADTGAAEETLVLLTADHGEEMYQHGILFDHHGLYDGNIHVPLILRHPSLPAGERVPEMVQHLDIAPTLLRWCGIDAPPTMHGLDLRGLVGGASGAAGYDRIVACESTWQSKWAVRTATRKLIVSRGFDPYGRPAHELYDLVADPGELHNVAEENGIETAELEAWLDAWIADGLSQTGREQDPLLVQGVTLGRRWDQWRQRR